MDPEPEGEGAHAVTAGRDAYVAGRDQFVFNVNVPKDESGASGEPGPGRRLFSARKRIFAQEGPTAWRCGPCDGAALDDVVVARQRQRRQVG